MNGTSYQVFAGLFGGYLVRDPAEAALGLPVCATAGEIVLVIQDRNLDCSNGKLCYVHKTVAENQNLDIAATD
ncbi:MAG: hypothetical protein EBU88_05670 [Acidobacteria bacterium]|nr:hypothetical protein [Acidobacteriota bacterium]